jgi:hypothetical protein
VALADDAASRHGVKTIQIRIGDYPLSAVVERHRFVAGAALEPGSRRAPCHENDAKLDKSGQAA